MGRYQRPGKVVDAIMAEVAEERRGGARACANCATYATKPKGRLRDAARKPRLGLRTTYLQTRDTRMLYGFGPRSRGQERGLNLEGEIGKS